MGLTSALFAGVSGLQIHQTMLDVVGNNLANANTTGFKSESVQFQDLIYQSLRDGVAPGALGAGGTNPQQIGFGAAVGSIASDFSQGNLQPTGRNLDLAIQGTGFFVLSDGLRNLYTRAGTFDLDPEGFVIDATTGFRVQRSGTVGEGTATTPAFQIPGDNNIQVPLGVGIPAQQTTSVTVRGNLSAALAVGDTYSTAIQVFDTQGGEHPLTMTFTKTAANTFSFSATVVGGTVTGVPVAGVSFNADGTLAGPSTAAISVAFPPNLPAPQPITINLGTAGQADGLSQFAGASTAAGIFQDGFAPGTLDTFSVSRSGTFEGLFTNGIRLPIAQLALSQFANQAGLSRQGQNLFLPTSVSGEPRISTPQAAGLGSIQSGTLEGSNVNVSMEFTRLIIAQRGFQINTRTVVASNELLQQLASLIQ